MRSLKKLRRTAELYVKEATVHGGWGEISIGSWKGTAIWGADEGGMEHVSVAPYDRSVTPSWDEMCRIKDILFDDEEMALQFHPRKSQYVNKVKNCLHLWRPKEKKILEYLEGRS